MKIGNQLGDRIYVKDDTFAWLPATIVGFAEDRTLVNIELPPEWQEVTEDGTKQALEEKRWINVDDYRDRVLPLQNDESNSSRDCADLFHLHEAALLYQIKGRHLQGNPYTRCGDIIVAVNPCTPMKELYSFQKGIVYAKSFVWQFEDCTATTASSENCHAEEKKDEHNPITSTSFGSIYNRLGIEPHLYEISALAYRGVFLDGKNQTILVSGESGAGKTESVKIVLHHLATLDTASMMVDGGDWPSNELVDHVMESSPVFEAFGNAGTGRNYNSSRFAKMTRLHYGMTSTGMCGLLGSSCQTYLLETNRVVSQAEGERNFHIFYQLLAAPRRTKVELLGESWGNKSPADFSYLNVGYAKDKDDIMWTKTHRSLEFFGWSGEKLKMLCGALGSILLLGNIAFIQDPESDGCCISTDDVHEAARIMGLNTSTLEHALRHRYIHTAGERLEAIHTPTSAKDSLDTLVRTIYNDIFDEILNSVNAKTKGQGLCESDGMIQILDLFGFEAFEVNRFEQLCINYTNEMLHKMYIDDNFERFKKEFDSEGIELFDCSQVDNVDVLDLLEGKDGIISMLNEECLIPNGSDQKFVQKLKSRHQSHGRLINENLMLKTQFGVKHFAAPVTYDASYFIDRNMRRLPSELLEVVSNTENMMICQSCKLALRDEVDSELEGNFGRCLRRSAQKQPVMAQFRSDLHDLMQSIRETETRYIRCVKPNESLIPAKVNLSTICRQLRCAGLVNAVDLTRETFPNKVPVETIAKRFECLLDETDQEASRQLPLHERVQFLLAKLFAERLEVYKQCEFTMPYACGKTRVFFRSGALEMLETLRFRHFSSRMIPIQACARRWISIHRVKRAWKGLFRLQAVTRSCSIRMKYISFRHSIMKIQAKVKSQRDRDLFLSQRRTAMVLQSFWRDVQKVKRNKREQAAATIVTAMFKLIRCRSSFLRTKMACQRIQALIRGYFIRRRLSVVLHACLCIQRFGQHVIALQVRKRKIETSSCTQIQANVRRFLSLKKFFQMKEAATSIVFFFMYAKKRLAFVKKRQAIVRLQAYFRMRSAQKRVLSIKMHTAAAKLQAIFRMRFVRQRYDTIRQAAIKVESFSRMAGKRITFITVYMAALKIQAFARMIALRSQYEEEFGRPIKSSESIDFSEVYTVRTSDSKETTASKISAYEQVRALRRQSLYDSSTKKSKNRSTCSRRHQVASTREADDVSFDKDGLIQSLQSELADMKEQEQILREEIAAVCDMAKEHEDMVAEDYDARIEAYEEEVISLKEAVDKYSAENEILIKQVDQQREEHARQIESYQKHARDMQKSHINYIRKVSVALDEAKELRQKETSGIMAEISCFHEAKEREIRQLVSEVDGLKKALNEKDKYRGSSSPRPDDVDKEELLFELRQLERAIKAVIKPTRILQVLERAERKSLSKEVYVEEKVTKRVEGHVSRLSEIIKILCTSTTTT